MLQKLRARLDHYKNQFRQNGTHIHAGVIVAVMVFVGFVGVYGIKAATYVAKSEAETGAVTGNASLSGDATASGGNSVVFGRGNGPAAPNALLTFTGGTSIALRWSESTAIGSIKQYNIFRNGTQVGTVTPGWHSNFPEKDGNGYIDSSVSGGSTYSYQVQAVNTANATSALSSSASATQPTSTTPVPNITYTLNGQTDLEPFIRDTAIPFLKIWYPKVADYEVFPGYSAPSSFSINVDPTYTGIAETDFGTGIIRFNPAYLRQNPHDLGAFLHESTHTLQGIHGQTSVAAYPNTPPWTWEAGADFSREFLLHDRDSGRPGGYQYYTDGYGPGSYFFNYIQTHYDSQYVRKLTVAGHNHTFSAANVTFGGNKNLDEVWAEMLGLPSHTGPFTSTASNKCMDDPGGSTTAGTNIQIYDCNGSMAQKFTAQPAANGTSTLHVLGGCLDVQDAGTANGTLVRYWDCNGNVAQQWVVHTDGTLVNPNSGKCLEVHGGNTTSANGTLLGIWDCAGAAWQKWNMPASTPTQSTGQVSFKSSSGQCLEDPGGNTAATTRFQVAACSGQAPQQWTVTRLGDGTANLKVMGLCMDVQNAWTTNGNPVWLYGCDGNIAQVWQIQSNGSLKNPNSGRCLDTVNSTITTGSQFVIKDCSGAASQTFNLPS